MSEVQSRPAASRGRGSGRGGRGGFASRGGARAGARPAATNGDSKQDTDSSLPTFEDEGDIGRLKQQYGSKVAIIKEMFPDWSEVDILYALQETDGDEDLTVTRIFEGKADLPLSPLLVCRAAAALLAHAFISLPLPLPTSHCCVGFCLGERFFFCFSFESWHATSRSS
jgi:hypothetical protein